jgi:8-oxo-dGTP pyrophosphatase MutT (NUDIX family)
VAGLRRLWLGGADHAPFPHVRSGRVQLGNSSKPTFFLAACVVIRNARGESLITRRAPHMRTFPRCWVFPGGGHDDREPIAYTALREAHEETGLQLEPSQLRRLCLWESGFPTTVETCEAAGGLMRHQLVVFFVCQLTEGQTASIDQQGISIDGDEVDEAVWLSPEHVAVLAKVSANAADGHAADDDAAERNPGGLLRRRPSEGIFLPHCPHHNRRSHHSNTNDPGHNQQQQQPTSPPGQPGVPLSDIMGIYPHPETGRGCAEGHVFALSVLAHYDQRRRRGGGDGGGGRGRGGAGGETDTDEEEQLEQRSK